MSSATDHKINDPRELFNVNKDMMQPSQEKAAVSLDGPQARVGGLNNAFNVKAGFSPVWNAAELQQNGPEAGNVPYITPQTNLLHQVDMASMTLSDPDMRGMKMQQSALGELGAGVGGLLGDLGQELQQQMQPALQPHMQPLMHPRPGGLFG